MFRLKDRKPFKFRTLLLISAAMLAFSAAMAAYHLSSTPERAVSTTPTVGAVASLRNDARYKSARGLEWQISQVDQSVHVGDSIFAGEDSSADVKLKKGGDLKVGENSLVVFSEIKEEKFANLMKGDFKVTVKGQAKIAIRGKIATIESEDGSSLHISTDDQNARRIEVLQGQAKVKLDNAPAPILIAEDQAIEIPVAEEPPVVVAAIETRPVIMPAGPPPVTIEAPTPTSEPVAAVAEPLPAIPPRLPELLMPPKLANREIEILSEEEWTLAWRPVEGAQSYQVLILTDELGLQGFEVREGETWTANEDYRQPLEGFYWVQARDAHGRLGQKAKGRLKIEAKVEIPRALASIPEDVKAPTDTPTISPAEKQFWIWVGGGLSYTAVAQDVPVDKQLKVSGIKTPSYMVRAGLWLTPTIGLDLGYKNTPGEVLGSNSFRVGNGAYDWQTFSGEALIKNPAHDWIWRLGVQQHQAPFFVPVSTTEITVAEITVTSASIGFARYFRMNERAQFEILGRYQYPLASSTYLGATHSVTPDLSFDGSMGATYRIDPTLRFGIFWYGQYNRYKFKHTEEEQISFEGKQSLFHSTVDLRLGLEF